MTDIIDRAQTFEELRRNAAINAAKGDIGRHGFEICETCGDEIEPARRAALPSARKCHDCQNKLERRARIFGG